MLDIILAERETVIASHLCFWLWFFGKYYEKIRQFLKSDNFLVKRDAFMNRGKS